MVQSDLQEVLDRIDNLPTIPLVADRIGQMVHDPKISAQQIAEVMRGDPALTVRVLKLVNSPYFGIPGGVSDVAHAVTYLGFNTLYQLVLTVSVFKVLNVASEERATQLFRHSLAVAAISEALAEVSRTSSSRDFFTAGLLHDLGRLALLQIAPDAFAHTEDVSREQDIPILEAERELGLPGHEELGMRLAHRWRLPPNIVASVGWHHRTDDADRMDLEATQWRIADVVAVADTICHRLPWMNSVRAKNDLPLSPLQRVGLTRAVEADANELIEFKIEQSELLMDLLVRH